MSTKMDHNRARGHRVRSGRPRITAVVVVFAALLAASSWRLAACQKPLPNTMSDAELAGMIHDVLSRHDIQLEVEIFHTDHFRLITTPGLDQYGLKKPASLLPMAEKVRASFVRLIGEKPDKRYWSGHADLYALGCRGECQFFVRNIMYRYDRMRTPSRFDSPQYWVLYPTPPAAFFSCSCARPPSHLPGLIANLSARLVILNYASNRWKTPDWLVEGYAILAEIECTGDLQLLIRTSTSPYKEWWLSLQSFQERPHVLVEKGTFRRFKELKALPQKDHTWSDLAQAYSLTTFLTAKHRPAFQHWVKLARSKPWDDSFQDAFGWTSEEVDDRWSAWVTAEAKAKTKAEEKNEAREPVNPEEQGNQEQGTPPR
jgi:hypothetical protein